MKKFYYPTRTLVVVGLASVLTGTQLVGSQPVERKIISVELGKLEVKENPALPGIGNTFVEGAFDKAGLYAAHSRMAKGSRFPPHSHPDVRLTVVTSGVMYLGQGETFDETKLVAYPVGTVAVTPAGVPHFMYSKDGDVTVLEVGSGPSGATFFKK